MQWHIPPHAAREPPYIKHHPQMMIQTSSHRLSSLMFQAHPFTCSNFLPAPTSPACFTPQIPHTPQRPTQPIRPLYRRCLVALYFVGADKAPMQAALAAAGAVAPVVRLCRSSQPELQAEAVDVVKVLSRHPRASRIIVDLGEGAVGDGVWLVRGGGWGEGRRVWVRLWVWVCVQVRVCALVHVRACMCAQTQMQQGRCTSLHTHPPHHAHYYRHVAGV